LAAVPLVPFLVAPDRAFGLFNPDPRVVAVAASVIGLGVVATVPLVVVLNLGGVLRAAGDTRTVLSASVAGDVVLVPWPGCSPSASASACAASSSPGLVYGLAYLAVSWWRYHGRAWRTSTV
jgi:hypothetical protein